MGAKLEVLCPAMSDRTEDPQDEEASRRGSVRGELQGAHVTLRPFVRLKKVEQGEPPAPLGSRYQPWLQ